MPNYIEIPVDLECEGELEVRVSEAVSAADRTVHIAYHPDKEPSKPIFFGSRDVTGMGKMLALTREDDGTWQTDVKMKPNESREFSMHVGMPEGPPDFTKPQHFKSKICLVNSVLISHVYEDAKLGKDKKGRIEKRVYKADGTLSEPVAKDYKTKAGEELVDIYIPANYSAEIKYPVQIFLDGDMHVGEDSFGNSIGTPNILDNLIEAGKMAPVVAIFTSPSPVASDGSNQRLREYACDSVTDKKLANLPQALANSGFSVATSGVTICGQSLGGLQAIYTAKMHPDVFGKVLAQSPAVWWEPPEELSGARAFYEIDSTWRHPLREPFPLSFPIEEAQQLEVSHQTYQGYIHHMLSTKKDELSGNAVPQGDIKIALQAGTHETGAISPMAGYEPLTQATKTLADQLDIDVFIHDGAHSSEPWAAGIATLLPSIQPRVELKIENKEGKSMASVEKVASQDTSTFKDKLNEIKTNEPSFSDSLEDKKDDKGLPSPLKTTLKPPGTE